ncbi:unnamed protein product [Bubo scandiacus]
MQSKAKTEIVTKQGRASFHLPPKCEMFSSGLCSLCPGLAAAGWPVPAPLAAIWTCRAAGTLAGFSSPFFCPSWQPGQGTERAKLCQRNKKQCGGEAEGGRVAAEGQARAAEALIKSRAKKQQCHLKGPLPNSCIFAFPSHTFSTSSALFSFRSDPFLLQIHIFLPCHTYFDF